MSATSFFTKRRTLAFGDETAVSSAASAWSRLPRPGLEVRAQGAGTDLRDKAPEITVARLG